jgi:hypothetical protein
MRKIVEDMPGGIRRITVCDERWYVKDKKFYPSVTWIASHYPKGIGFYKWLANTGWNEAEAIKRAAGEKGSKIHQAIEHLLRGNELEMDSTFIVDKDGDMVEEQLDLLEYEAVMHFTKWHKEYKPTPIVIEAPVFSEQHNYAGTMDLLCAIPRFGQNRVLIDFKTSQYIWPSHEIQLSAYKHALIEEEPEFGPEIKLAVLQIGYKRNENGWKFTTIDDKFDLFQAARQIWHEECGTQEPLIKDYPTRLKL